MLGSNHFYETNILERYFEFLEKKYFNKRRIVVFVDSSFSEFVKIRINSDDKYVYRKKSYNTYIKIFGLKYDQITFSKLVNFEPDILVFQSSLIPIENLQIIKLILENCESGLISLHSPHPLQALNSIYPNISNFGDAIEFLKSKLSCENIQFVFTPYPLVNTLEDHSCREINQKEKLQFNVNILSDHKLRKLSPITLTQLQGKDNNSIDLETIYDLNAIDLPENEKIKIKHLAFHLASALLMDLCVSPISSMFAWGKSSSLLGHNLLPILEILEKASKDSTFAENFRNYLDNSINTSLPKHRSCSLIIIDRHQDLFSPLGFSTSCPLAHKILSTISQKHLLKHIENKLSVDSSGETLDLSLSPISMGRNLPSQSLLNPLLRPMSALSGLPFKTPPTLFYNPHHDFFYQYTDHKARLEKISHLVLFSIDEEMLKMILCDELKERIVKEFGSLPSNKKRKFGAEVFAYIQALLGSKGMDNPNQQKIKSNFNVWIRSHGLVSLCYSIIETMQRSSEKQFRSICSFQNSYDTRSSIDMMIEKNALTGFDECVSFLTLKITHKMSLMQSKTNNEEVVDIEYIIMQLIRLTSLFRYKEPNSSQLGDLIEKIIEFVIEFSEAPELENLVYLNFLDESLFQSIFELRSLNENESRTEYESKKGQLKGDIRKSFSLLFELIRLNQREEFCIKNEFYKQEFNLLSLFKEETKLSSSEIQKSYEIPGILYYIVKEHLDHQIRKKKNLNQKDTKFSQIFEYIQSPLEKMKQAGLGLLSKGLGSLGFMQSEIKPPDPSPFDNENIVLFIYGGISYHEIGQIENLIMKYRDVFGISSNIYLLSNNTISPSDVITRYFESKSNEG